MRDLAQRMGGTLDITSEPGRWTTVSVSLPIRELTATSANQNA
jgi:signal transduction histidine kinase